MTPIKSKSYKTLSKLLSGKTVHFISDCEFFPNFNVTGKILNSSIKGTELVFKVKTKSGKIISVGSNMRNLQFEIVNQ